MTSILRVSPKFGIYFTHISDHGRIYMCLCGCACVCVCVCARAGNYACVSDPWLLITSQAGRIPHRLRLTVDCLSLASFLSIN